MGYPTFQLLVYIFSSDLACIIGLYCI